MAEKVVPGYVFEDTIKCNWNKASDPTFVYNDGIPAVTIEVPFKFEQVRDCSSHIVKAANYD